ncbi:MAG TPA: hypothetical protein VFM23_02175, partial [Gemmatimonadales bacterium]|nr:hypothetical protein [Gemmatimonadales bacterium]
MPITALLFLLAQTQAPDIAGLWEATLRFGPDVRGTLLVMRTSDGWRADISGYSVATKTLSFELPDDTGGFKGRVAGREIHGYWIQPRTNYNGGRYATPVTLVADGPGRWRGTVT